MNKLYYKLYGGMILSILFLGLSGCSFRGGEKDVGLTGNKYLEDNGGYISKSFDVVDEEGNTVDVEQNKAMKSTVSTSLMGSAYMQDEGTVTVQYEGDMLTAENIGSYLQSDTPLENSQASELKQAAIEARSNQVILRDMGFLKDGATCIDCRFSGEGEDLYIDAYLPQNNISWVIISPELEKNILVENGYDRFGDALYMIPKGEFSLLKIKRGSAAGGMNLIYEVGDSSYTIDALWAQNESLFYKSNTYASIPENTELVISQSSPDGATIAQGRIYHVYSTDTASNKKQQLIDELATYNADAYTVFDQQANYRDNAVMIDRNMAYDEVYNGPLDKVNVKTNNASYQAFLVVEPTYTYLFAVSPEDFSASLSFADVVENQGYRFNIETNQQIDIEKSKDQIISLFGSGRVNFDNFTRGGIITQFIPNTTYAGDITFTSIFGETVTTSLKYSVDELDSQLIHQEILSNNTISILPKSGVFQDILFQYRNTPGFEVFFEACVVKKELDKDALLQEFRGSGIEDYFFECDENSRQQAVVSPQDEVFTYRKTYRTAISIPEELNTFSAFRVFFIDKIGNEQSHYLVTSDVGSRAKIDQSGIHIWNFLLKDGTPLKGGTVSVSTIGGEPIAAAKIEQGYSFVSLPQGNQRDYEQGWRQNTYKVDIETAQGSNFVIVHRTGNEEIGVPTGDYDRRYLKLNAKLSPHEVKNEDQQDISTRDTFTPTKLYGYSDRAMYKIGDTIHMAGFLRNILNEVSLEQRNKEKISISLTTPEGDQAFFVPGISLDTFGGFTGAYTIPEGAVLGDYFITYMLESNDQITYSHLIKIQDYQKPTFFADMRIQEENNVWYIDIEPEYYFGEPLRAYDINLSRSVEGSDQCRYCWWRNDENEYYNHSFATVSSAIGNKVVYNQSDEKLRIPLEFLESNEDITDQSAYKRTVKIDAIIKDLASDETQFFTKYIDYEPDVSLGLSGQPYEWLYANDEVDTRKNRNMQALIGIGKELINTLSYEVYYQDYEQTLNVGVDAHLYYINNEEYTRIASGSLSPQTSMSLPNNFIDQAGSYFVRVFAKNDAGNLIGEVQKKISFYTYGNQGNDIMGLVPNNYSLVMDVPAKTYDLGENIPVNISPYIKGSYVVVTIEKGQYILDTIVQKLDGSPISIPVKDTYAPNIIVNVMQLQGADQNDSLRKEPRFFAGYADVDIDPDMHVLDMSIALDKQVYKPGDTATMRIVTKNHKDDLVDARVSVAVIDQALVNLYHEIKNPLSHFFSTMGTSVHTYTNMKLLYQSLKAFSTGGSKGGDGGGGQAMVGFVRNDLKDTAFWKADIITKNGKAEVSFIVPDNMTTRLVDTIGVGKQNQLGTQTANFTVQKPLIIEGNPPLYMTLGDTIHMPIKTFVSQELPGESIVGDVSITNSQGETIELGTFTSLPNQKVLAELYMPPEWKDSPYITLMVKGTYGSYEDGIEHIIPIRTDGLLMKEVFGGISMNGSTSFVAPAESYTQTVDVRIGALPTNFIEPIVEYLIGYPYGCTEQIMSRMLPLVSIQKLSQNNIFHSSRVSKDGLVVYTDEGPLTIQQVLQDGFHSMIKNQQENGMFSYRGTDTTISKENYYLSAYLYGGLLELDGYIEQDSTLKNVLRATEAFLWKYRSLDDDGFLYYLFQKSKHYGSISTEEQEVLETLRIKDQGYRPLLRYLIAVHTQDKENTNLWRPLAQVPTNDEGGYNAYLHPVVADAYLLHASYLDDQVDHAIFLERLGSLLKQRDTNGLRGWSSQTNAQVLDVFAKIADVRPTGTVSCDIAIVGTDGTAVLSHKGIVSGYTNMNTDLTAGETYTANWTCNGSAFVDILWEYMPKDVRMAKDEMTHVLNMIRDISDMYAPIGSKVTIASSFTTNLVGEKVAVDLFVPADYKLLNIISAREKNELYPFTVSDSHCYPDHWETRYDRLFLYYDVLPTGTCDITIDALKAYNGNTTVMPFRVWEMYRGSVYGRKIIKNTND